MQRAGRTNVRALAAAAVLAQASAGISRGAEAEQAAPAAPAAVAPERYRNMDKLVGSLETSTTQPEPEVVCYLPLPAERNGAAVIIFPGGGYGGLAAHEGKEYAEYLRREGFSCFVVAYRLGSQGHRHPAMLEDALSAVYAVRSRADALGIDTDRIGVMGSSAGGHLASQALVAYGKYASTVSLRPDFGILCYPVVCMVGPFCHQGSRDNLLGANAPEALRQEVSSDLHVTADTPPCFIWHTWTDTGVPVENSLMFAAALRKQGVHFDLHIYDGGGHGLGLRTDHAWARDCVGWLKRINR